MSAATPQPPYTFPRQKPTDESGDEDGDILIKADPQGHFYWHHSSDLEDGDVWVPGCDEFFQDQGLGTLNYISKVRHAIEHWTVDE